jgi:hypothetical protein
VQVYKESENGPEKTTNDFDQVPEGALLDRKKCRYAGQPLVGPHADGGELWPAYDSLLALLVWCMLGSPPGQLEAITRDVRRCDSLSILVSTQLK